MSATVRSRFHWRALVAPVSIVLLLLVLVDALFCGSDGLFLSGPMSPGTMFIIPLALVLLLYVVFERGRTITIGEETLDVRHLLGWRTRSIPLREITAIEIRHESSDGGRFELMSVRTASGGEVAISEFYLANYGELREHLEQAARGRVAPRRHQSSVNR